MRLATRRPRRAGAAKSSQPMVASPKNSLLERRQRPPDARRDAVLQRVHRRPDAPVTPDEHAIEDDEQNEPDDQPRLGRERRDDTRHSQAGPADERDSGRLTVERVGPEPRERVQPRHRKRRQPGSRPPPCPSRAGGQDRRDDRCQSRQEVCAAGRARERDSDRHRSRRDDEPERARRGESPRPSRHEHERGLDGNQQPVRGDESHAETVPAAARNLPVPDWTARLPGPRPQ